MRQNISQVHRIGLCEEKKNCFVQEICANNYVSPRMLAEFYKPCFWSDRFTGRSRCRILEKSVSNFQKDSFWSENGCRHKHGSSQIFTLLWNVFFPLETGRHFSISLPCNTLQTLKKYQKNRKYHRSVI